MASTGYFLAAAFFEIAGCFAFWAWLRGVEGIVPDRWGLLGSGIAVLGALVVLLGPRP